MFGTLKNIANALTVLPALLALVPKITELVHQVEQSGVSGADKKQAALDILGGCIDVAQTAFALKLPRDTIVAWADGIIDVIVTVENALGRLLPHKAASEA